MNRTIVVALTENQTILSKRREVKLTPSFWNPYLRIVECGALRPI
jgi:hypothetical protein